MKRQFAKPIVLSGGHRLHVEALPLGHGTDQVSEADLQRIVHENPQSLPVNEIDPIFANPVPLCMELTTNAGAIDNLMVTPSGLPIIVECKLWRNPEGRREVVGQILDYAKELSRWSASDFQREVARRVERPGNPVISLVREAGHEVDEIAFTDALTHNLRRGRFLLLIIGDGIREGVEAIAEYLQVHAGLHFSLALIEMPIFEVEGDIRIILPRVLARTQMITRTVVSVPEGFAVTDDEQEELADEEALDPLSRINFWKDFLSGLELDDPEQRKPRPGRSGWLNFVLPVPSGNAWLNVYRSEARWEVGLYLSYTRNTVGAEAVQRVVEDWRDIQDELGGTAELFTDKLERQLISDRYQTLPWTSVNNKDEAIDWLRRRTNDFVNVLRPRIRSAMMDIEGERS